MSTAIKPIKQFNKDSFTRIPIICNNNFKNASENLL